MSEITQKNINAHANEVSRLKSDFLRIYKTDEQSVDKIIRQMREIHGRAILDAAVFKQSIIAKGNDNISNDDRFKISSNASIIDLIHHHIRRCEKLAYEFKQRNTKNLTGNVNSDTLTPDTDMLSKTLATKANNAGKMNAIIRRNETGTDELSIQNIKTESASAPSNINASDLFSPADNTSKTNQGQTTPVNTTEYLERLSTDEAERMYQELNRNRTPGQTGGHEAADKDINKPTLINYWADWCPASKRFLPMWEQFKANAKAKYPQLQISDLNVGRNTKLNEIAKKAGVKGYPTVVLFYNNKIYHKVGGSSVEQLDQFINNAMNTKN